LQQKGRVVVVVQDYWLLEGKFREEAARQVKSGKV
jgi:hypothetical protein